MALETYTGRVTDFSRKPFTPGEAVELVVIPTQPGYGGQGLLADKPIPVTVATNGDFSVQLETTASVRPAGNDGRSVLYTLRARYLAGGNGSVPWVTWANFYAEVGGGNIAELTKAPAPPWSISYGFGPPPTHITGLYIDITGPDAILYGPDRGI